MPRKLSIILVLCVAVLLVLNGCSRKTEQMPDVTEPQATEVAAPTIPADGNPNDVTCHGSYYGSPEEAAAAADTVVATMGEATLTNAQLQIYYWLEVAACRQAGLANGPDFAQPLDTQLVPISSRVLTWQQYFLESALNTWASQQALVLMGQEEGIPTEAEYKPDLAKRAEYMTGMPATQYLYGWNQSYIPNRLHQTYLEEMPSTLIDLAYAGDYGTVRSMAKALFGTDNQSLLHYMNLANRAYMYFTEMGYHFEPTQEEINAYYTAHQADIPSSGEKTVDIRHILLVPENAQVAADGTVTASENDWNRCLTQANSLIDKWQKAIKRTRYSQYAVVDVAESRFSETAKNNSADTGSSINGGLYVQIRQGQLAPELDAWCFDPARQHGDYEIIRSACGYHIVFFSSATEDWYTASESGLRKQYFTNLIAQALGKHPTQISYSAICLGQIPDNGGTIIPSDLLYPDVAHERFPDMPLYLQQDYPDAPYGNYTLSGHGCGITTLAMVASYLADDELTPVELAARYGYYCGRRGTEIVIFDDTPAEMGFQLQNRSYSWNEINEALQNGQVVISLQWVGYWTSGGHYLAMIGMTEDDKYVVRDSNLLNYKRIPAHQNDCHTRGSISQAGQYYWIYEKKVTSIPSCVRCGAGNAGAAPEVMFRSDYLCQKCLTATERRSLFLSLVSE